MKAADVAPAAPASPPVASHSSDRAPAEVPRLRVIDLERRFGDRRALAGMSLAVNPGEIFGLLGPNGAGKTTAFRVLAGLIPAHGGRVEIDGRPTGHGSADLRARLGVVFQDPAIDLKLSARENLVLGAALYGVPRALARQRIAEALAFMDLGARADEPAERYSGGMRRRVEIARVLLHDPDLLLLDEPGRGVDPEALRRIWDHLCGLRAQRQRSIVVTTHQPEEAERCDRVAILDAGRVVAAGTPDELRARVAGDVLHVDGDGPAEIAAAISARLALPAVVLDGRVVIETPRGHEAVPRVVELFPAGRLRSVATARPSLADVFGKLTGRRLGGDQTDGTS